MVSDPGLLTYSEDLKQEILSDSSLEDAESFRAETFTSYVLDLLEEEGETEDWSIGYLRKRGVEVSAFAIPEGEQRIDLFTTIYFGSSPPTTIGRDRISTAFDRLLGFFKQSTNGLHANLEESSLAFDAARHIHDEKGKIRKLRLYVLTDGLTTIDHIDDDMLEDVSVVKQVWDIGRIYRQHSSGASLSPVNLDLEQAGFDPIPCLIARDGDQADFTAYMAMIPGPVLAWLYDVYGQRLLERNVRTYLTARGKVNRGILETIKAKPEHFLAYNNGITITAETITVRPSDTTPVITQLTNMQIVNGGQTTASIHRAMFNESADVSTIMVPAKIIQVDQAMLEELVPKITRYANSQNKVSEADLTANDPFNVTIEELSRSIWAPTVGGSQRQTRWFFERARGQYQELKNRAGTPARQREFAQRHPPRQKFAKTDLAKFVNTWDQLPHDVSKGNVKNYAIFMDRITDRGGLKPDGRYFQRMIAKAILFKAADKIVKGQKIPGPYANIITYTIAYISNKTSQRVNLDEIWNNQSISENMEMVIHDTSMEVRKIIEQSEAVYAPKYAPKGTSHLAGNWVRNLSCWTAIQEEVTTDPMAALDSELIPHGYVADSLDTHLDAKDEERIGEVTGWGSDDWFAVAAWARETENLQPWQRSISFNIGKFMASGRDVSRKMARRGVDIQKDAKRLGFVPSSDR